MVSIQARIFATILRLVFRPGWYYSWTRQNTPRDRGGGIGDAVRRPNRGFSVKPVNAGSVPCAWIEPEEARAAPLILYLHGGAYTSGSYVTYLDMLGLLARAYGVRSLYVDYRLAPRHVFPAAVDDSLEVYRWLLDSGVSPAHVIFAGDSAGGGLALATMLAARNASLALPAGGTLLSPWTDLEGTGASLETRRRADPMLKPPRMKPSGHVYLGGANARSPLASPLFADLSGLPPLLIHVGDAEILLDDSTRFADRAREAGVDVTLRVWPGLFHVFPLFPSALPEARKAVSEMASFILAHAR